MLMLRLDVKSDLEVRWPLTDSEIITLGQAYVARESALASDERVATPSLSLIQQTLAQTQAAATAATSGEAERAASAEAYRSALEELRPLLEIAIVKLKAAHVRNLAELEQWGLQTKSGARGITVSKPSSAQPWADFAAAYVAKEQSQPEADRITDPPFAQVSALSETVQQNAATRQSARNQRTIGVRARASVGAQLLDMLQVAAGVLLVTRYHGAMSEELVQWGYAVVTRTRATAQPNDTPPPPPPPT
jgi:hypothetical protein